MIARVDFLGKLVAGAGLGDYVPAGAVEFLQYRIAELQDLNGAFITQLAQPQCVAGVELRQGARVFGRGCVLEDPPVASVEALPNGLVDAESYAGARLVESRIVILARDFMETHSHVEPGPDPLAAVDGARFDR